MKVKRSVICFLIIVCSITICSCSDNGMKKVSFIYPEADNYTKPYTLSIEKGKSISAHAYAMPEPYRLGYSFSGWEVNGEPFSEDTIINKKYTVKATWQKHDLKILSSEGGVAEFESTEKWPDMGTRYKIKYTTNEGFYLHKWLIQYEGREAYSPYDEELYIVLDSHATSCEVTPIFTDKIIPVRVDVSTYGGDGSDGGTVNYPEFAVGERNFDIEIKAAEGYYIMNYGFMQADSDVPNLVHSIGYSFVSPSDVYSFSAKMHFRDTAFGAGEEKWFYVSFVEKSQAQFIRALMKEGDSTFSISVSVVMIGNMYEVTAQERSNSTFSHWIDSNGDILSYENQYRYTVTDAGQRTIYAIYDDKH